MKVALIQLAYGDDESVTDRTARVTRLVREQKGHDLVVLPELWPAGGFDYRRWDERAEAVDGPVATALADAARDAGVTLHGGSIVERGEPAAEGEHGVWNTSLVFSPQGELVATYRKIHRFGFGDGEPRLMDAGEEAVVVAAAWPMRRVEHWTLLGRARAVEDQCVVLQCNTAGTHAGHEMGGHSQAVDATGRVLAEAGEGEEVLSVEVDVDAVRQWREDFPVLAD